MVACRQAVGLESRVHGLMFRCDAITGHRAGMECLARCANGVVSPSPGGGFARGAVCFRFSSVIHVWPRAVQAALYRSRM